MAKKRNDRRHSQEWHHISGGVEGHAKGERHPYLETGYSVADTAQALTKLAHSSDSRYQARPADVMVKAVNDRVAGIKSALQTALGANRRSPGTGWRVAASHHQRAAAIHDSPA